MIPEPFPHSDFKHQFTNKPTPFTATPVRHLIYHIWPKASNDNWLWNIQHLLRYIDQFDGVRSIAVATDQGTKTLADIQNEFKGVRIDNWIERQNNEIRRECVTFVPLMRTLPQGENDITFYAHAKGVRHDGGNNTPVIWAHVQYRLCLEFPYIVEEHLQKFGVTGNFKRHDEFRLPKHAVWHYSGTFFWFRNNVVFNRDGWDDLAPNFFAGVEAWPSRIFNDYEAGVIFGDNPGNLYQLPDWHRLLPKLREFGINVDLG